MGVNTSEEYLDELLQAIEPIIYTDEPVSEQEKTQMPDSDMMPEEEALKKEAVINTEEAAEPEFSTEEEVSVNDLLATFTADADEESEGESMSEEDIDAMLSEAMSSAVASGESAEYDADAHDEDVKELLKQFADDEDLTDIGDILERNDNSEAVDESVLQTPDVEVFHLEEEKEETEEEKTEKAKGIFGFFKKKRRNKKSDRKKAAGIEEDINEETEKITEARSLKANVEAEIGDREWEEVSTEENTVAVEAVEELDADVILGDSDTADIEMLLSNETFAENEKSYKEELQDVSEKGEQSSKSVKKKEKAQKKESLFTRIFNMLTEEEEETSEKSNVEKASVSDENAAVLDELSKEDKKKTKLEKKEQKKKEKEERKNGKVAPDGEEDEEGGNKKDKKQKKAKVKKEKLRKVVESDAKPEKKLPRKKVAIVFLFCFSILAMILILQNVFLNLNSLKEARWAFDNADYETCYANLYGKDLSDEDEEIFEKSYVILCVQRKLDSYENFVRLGMEPEAVDALFEGIRVYRDMEEHADELGILDRISGIYQTFYENLAGYGLDYDEIEEILDYDSRVTYTKRLDSIANGTPFETENAEEEPDKEVETDAEGVDEELDVENLEDVLPQEEDFLQ